MSVSDPLVKDIKGCVQQFLTPAPINDNDFYFVFFCQTLEKIFNKGLIRQQNTKYFNRTIDAYAWMVSVAREKDPGNLTYRTCVDSIKDKTEISSNDGRFRCLVKKCLMKKCLHISVERLIESQIAHLLYSSNSILGDEILLEIFLSVLRQVSKVQFSLDLTNCSFLDTSWYIPEIITMELVPCKTLGIAVSFCGNKAVIVNIEPNGVLAENNKITIGDVLDNLNGTHIDLSCKGRLSSIMKSKKNKPILVRVAKAIYTDSNELYQPIDNLLKELKLDIKLKKQEQNIDDSNSGKKTCYGYAAKYLAVMNVGTLGNVKQVQKSIKSLLNNNMQDTSSVTKFDLEVSLEIGEIGLKIRDKNSNEIIMEHPYMKISACGNLPHCPTIFGYCAGKENCDIAKDFQCYVFESRTFDDTDTILQSIGQGFHRTHYAV